MSPSIRPRARPRFSLLLTTTLLLLWPLIQAQQLVISADGNCGASFSQTCLGSRFGDCCSGRGFCGGDADYCGADCQSGFETCTNANSESISSDGNCGATDPEKQVCNGSEFGDSCSKNGFCGSGSDFAGQGCQADFGVCDGVASSGNSTSSTSTSAPSATSSNSRTVSTQSPTGTPSATDTASPSTGTAVSDSASTNTPASPSATATPTPLSTGVKAGIAIAAVAAAALFGAALFLFLRRRRQSQNRLGSISAPSPYDSNTNNPNDNPNPLTKHDPAHYTQKPHMSSTTTYTNTTTTPSTATTPSPPYSFPSQPNNNAYPYPAGGFYQQEKDNVVAELPQDPERNRVEMRSGPITPSFPPVPVEKDAGTLGVVSELSGSSRWSAAEDGSGSGGGGSVSGGRSVSGGGSARR